ncbi:MAG: hypothetical protein ABIP74_01820, partial [Candidatus Saccharimonas sp.]
MISKNKSAGNAHVIIVICLVVALLGVLGVVFYQNFIVKSDKATQADTKDSTTNSESAKAP